MVRQHKIQPVVLRELGENQKASKKEAITLEEAISFIEKGYESVVFDKNQVITQELIMKPLLKMANRIR